MRDPHPGLVAAVVSNPFVDGRPDLAIWTSAPLEQPLAIAPDTVLEYRVELPMSGT